MDRLHIQLQMLPGLCKIVRKPKATNVADLSSAFRLGDVAARMLELGIILSIICHQGVFGRRFPLQAALIVLLQEQTTFSQVLRRVVSGI